MHDRKQEIVELFEAHGSLVEPALAEDLADSDDGAVRVQAVLNGLTEVPFHFDIALWKALERKHRESAEQPVSIAPAAPKQAAARKEAFRQAAAAIYDQGKVPQRDPDADDDPADDHDDEVAILEKPATEEARVEAREFKIELRSEWQPLAAQHEGRIEVRGDMTGNSTCEGTTSDFVTYFQSRYKQISKMLRQRRELRAAAPIERIKPGQQEVQIIAMVVGQSITKNGHRIIEIEDESGESKAFINVKETQLQEMASTLVTDEVIGLVGTASPKGDLIYCDSIIRPDIPRFDDGRRRGAEVPLMAAFLSDIHVGSNTFLTENWKSMLRWLSGDAPTKRERDLAGRIKYLLLPGDLVDGVGVYPGQQEELTIVDIYDQYEAFGDWIKSVPDHIDFIVQPGNHDAARPAEPQPAFGQEVKSRFDHHKARFLANPSTFDIHGVKTLGYHGMSLIDFATSVTNLDYEKPLETMEQMLQCRHLAPLYGERTPVAPEHEDHLVISDIPDIFVTGHVHVPGIRNYRGVQMVNTGTWQAQTLYQKMLSFTPDPAKMPLMDLQTLRGTLVDFSHGLEGGVAIGSE